MFIKIVWSSIVFNAMQSPMFFIGLVVEELDESFQEARGLENAEQARH